MFMIEKYPKQKCDIYFPDYDWTAKNRSIASFKKGAVQCPYEPRTYGVGYLGEGPYVTRPEGSEPGSRTIEYNAWAGMIRRCHDLKLIGK